MPVKIRTDSFALSIAGVSTSDYDIVVTQNPKKLELVTVRLTYRVSLHQKAFSFTYA